MRSTAVLCMALVFTLTACGGSSKKSASDQQLQQASDYWAIDQIERTWHRAASTKNVNLMMSLWTNDATFNIGTKTLNGAAEIRKFFESAGPFLPQNHWVSDTPAYKIRITASGDKGTIYFECHYVDTKTDKVVAAVGADQNVQKINGKWLITSAAAATPKLKP